MISTKANKPAGIDARPAVNWLPAGPLSTLLIMRNMLPESGFTNSIQAAHYGSEAADMGAYFPATMYRQSFSC